MRNLFTIDAHHFNASIEVERGRIVYAAPILKWAIGKKTSVFWEFCRRKRWKVYKHG